MDFKRVDKLFTNVQNARRLDALIKRVGKKLSRIRSTRNLSLQQVATATNISLADLVAIESGNDFKLDMLFRLAEFYDISAADLL